MAGFGDYAERAGTVSVAVARSPERCKKKVVGRVPQSARAVTDVPPGQTQTERTDEASAGVNSLLFDLGPRGRLGVLERPVRAKSKEKKNCTSPPVIFNGRLIREENK